MPFSATPPSPTKRSALALFTAAVAAAAAALGIFHFQAQRHGRLYSVRYTAPSGQTVHTTPAVSGRSAVIRFEKAVQEDLVYSLDC